MRRLPSLRGQLRASRLATEDFRLTAPLNAVSEHLEPALDLIQGQGISLVELDSERLPSSLAELDDLLQLLQARDLSVAVLRARLRSPELLLQLLSTAEQIGAHSLYVGAPAMSLMARRALVGLLQTLGRLAREQQVTVLLGNRPGSWAETAEQLAGLVAEVGSPSVRASYDPAGIVQAGGSPFYEGLYRGELRRHVQHLDLRDLVASEGCLVSLGSGNGEITEIISGLRCRSYDGLFCLWPLPGDGSAGFRSAAESFWRILDDI